MEKLKNQLKWSKKQTAYAWAKYYQELRESHERVLDLYEYHTKMMETEKELPRHIVTDFENMCAELKKDIVCPICFDVIEKGNLKITGCGHKYCNECFDKIETCAVCRKKIRK